jgi:hypothetical protein
MATERTLTSNGEANDSWRRRKTPTFQYTPLQIARLQLVSALKATHAETELKHVSTIRMLHRHLL